VIAAASLTSAGIGRSPRFEPDTVNIPPHVSKNPLNCVRNIVIASAAGLSTTESRERAFDEVVGRDTERLCALARSILRDEGEAQDAVQETLVKAWRSWDSLSLSDHTSRWLTRVCVNHCISRRRYLRSQGWPPLERLEHAGSPDNGSASAPIRDIDLDRAYRSLSLKQRAAITLTFGHGYSVDECAALMGCRPGTVRTHVARGLATLRKELGDA
jgi:RNA polymerase sigma factor (sigma-70 family)